MYICMHVYIYIYIYIYIFATALAAGHPVLRCQPVLPCFSKVIWLCQGLGGGQHSAPAAVFRGHFYFFSAVAFGGVWWPTWVPNASNLGPKMRPKSEKNRPKSHPKINQIFDVRFDRFLFDLGAILRGFWEPKSPFLGPKIAPRGHPRAKQEQNC